MICCTACPRGVRAFFGQLPRAGEGPWAQGFERIAPDAVRPNGAGLSLDLAELRFFEDGELAELLELPLAVGKTVFHPGAP